MTETKSTKPGETLSDYLWDKTAEYRQQALGSKFIHGLREGCLDPSEFGGYMVDDSVYCFKVLQSLKKAAEKCTPDTSLHQFLNSKTESWRGIGAKSCNTWHIKSADGIKLGDAASNYIEHIRNVAENEIPVYTILALTPCAKLWPWLGEQIGSGTRDFGVYTSWVEENLNPKRTGFLEHQEHVERAYGAGKITIEKAVEIFTASMQCEVDFFNSVSRQQPSNYKSRTKPSNRRIRRVLSLLPSVKSVTEY